MKLALAAAILLLGCSKPIVQKVNEHPVGTYVLECSDDGKTWHPVKDSKCGADTNFERERR